MLARFGLAIEAEAFLYWMVAVTMRKWGYIHGTYKSEARVISELFPC